MPIDLVFHITLVFNTQTAELTPLLLSEPNSPAKTGRESCLLLSYCTLYCVLQAQQIFLTVISNFFWLCRVFLKASTGKITVFEVKCVFWPVH